MTQSQISIAKHARQWERNGMPLNEIARRLGVSVLDLPADVLARASAALAGQEVPGPLVYVVPTAGPIEISRAVLMRGRKPLATPLRDRLIELLRAGPLSAAQLYAAVKSRPNSIRSCLSRARAAGLVVIAGVGTEVRANDVVWSLPS